MLTIYTVNYPIYYFAQRIAGDNATVEFPAPADVDPAFWQPDAEIITAYQKADLILLNGAGYAKWVNRVSLPRRKLVDTSTEFRDYYIHVEQGVTHSHGPDGEHSHTGLAFTTWLDFNQAAQQARAIAAAMIRIRPHWQQDIERNLDRLEVDLQELDKQIETIVATQPHLPLLASHPVYQYFQRRYQLNLVSVLWEPDEMPNEALWTEMTGILKQNQFKWMIWEGQPTVQTTERLQSLGVASIVFDPAANRPEQGDFLSVMKNNIDNLQKVYQ